MTIIFGLFTTLKSLTFRTISGSRSILYPSNITPRNIIGIRLLTFLGLVPLALVSSGYIWNPILSSVRTRTSDTVLKHLSSSESGISIGFPALLSPAFAKDSPTTYTASIITREIVV